MTDMAVNYARCFGTPAGRAVLAHLRKMTIERTLGPNTSDSELRWIESQRALVRTIESQVAQGRGDNT
ncbi:MAG: hypothetical protein IJD69_04320 [Alphaproteobacteria bacterium]|nr:hypothetical protein [Alphaproteobacteria bacterium]MBQ4130570.1 hypothetical protein [Alphaproteobacteria bacterium]MBQ8729278.1 hypothetical protein [Alphaproteobacteria bacterium]